jgi:DNA-binding Lrp family transcriptional regulator
MLLLEEQTKILKFMNEMTGHVDMNEFAKKTGLTSTQIAQDMQALAKDGFLKKVGGGLTITPKGKAALKAVAPLPKNLRFEFYFALSQPAGVSAGSVKEFHEAAGKVSAASLEFHLGRGDFENWFRIAVGDASLADDFAKMQKTELKGEDLKAAITKAVEAKYPL